MPLTWTVLLLFERSIGAAPTALTSVFLVTHTFGFLPKTRKSGAFWSPFACARLSVG